MPARRVSRLCELPSPSRVPGTLVGTRSSRKISSRMSCSKCGDRIPTSAGAARGSVCRSCARPALRCLKIRSGGSIEVSGKRRWINRSTVPRHDWSNGWQPYNRRRASGHRSTNSCCGCAALSELPEKYRTAIELRHLKRHKLAETAAIMGVSSLAVAGLLRRALERLRDRLGVPDGDSPGPW